jgi:uncharacterized protein YecE (DUF72 family)
VRLHVGTSGFNYPEWRGSFYPERMPPSRMLSYYAERLGAVEINATFYRMPTPATLAGWSAATPAHFVFALKASQKITHFARLRDVGDPVRHFCQVAQTLGPQLGPVLFQLPPNLARDAGRLADLLALLPAGLATAFEFRHPSWFADEVYEHLRSRGAALCVADTEEGTTPVVATARFGYLRLRDRAYADADLVRWIRRAGGMGWAEAYVFFKHEESGTGPALARRLLDLAGTVS